MSRRLRNTIALWGSLLLTILIGPAVCHSTETIWNAEIASKTIGHTGVFAVQGGIDERQVKLAFTKCPYVPGGSSIDIEYDPDGDYTTVTIHCLDGCDWSLVGPCIAAEMGVNSLE